MKGSNTIRAFPTRPMRGRPVGAAGPTSSTPGDEGMRQTLDQRTAKRRPSSAADQTRHGRQAGTSRKPPASRRRHRRPASRAMRINLPASTRATKQISSGTTPYAAFDVGPGPPWARGRLQWAEVPHPRSGNRQGSAVTFPVCPVGRSALACLGERAQADADRGRIDDPVNLERGEGTAGRFQRCAHDGQNRRIVSAAERLEAHKLDRRVREDQPGEPLEAGRPLPSQARFLPKLLAGRVQRRRGEHGEAQARQARRRCRA